MRVFLFLCLVISTKLWSFDQFVVTAWNQRSYGHGYVDYLRLLYREQRTAAAFSVTPNGVECLYGRRSVTPCGDEDLYVDAVTAERFCRLLARRNLRFALRLRSWNQLGVIRAPFLQNIARDLASRRPHGGDL